MQHHGEESLLTPCLRRLSNQLHVDFAADVRGVEGKRKREPTRSIYEEADHNMKMAAKERTLRRMMKNSVVYPRKKCAAKQQQQQSSAEISEVEGEEDNNQEEEDNNQTFISMMHAAASLAELRVRSEQAHRISIPIDQQIVALETSFETMSKAHADTVAAKDEVIRTINATLVAKEELIRTQAALIKTMMQQSDVGRNE